MSLTIVGLNHQTAPVAVRERLAVSQQDLPQALLSLLGTDDIAEALILSTCNRTEIYAVGQPESIVRWLSAFHRLPVADFQQYLYIYQQQDCVRHAFRVSCGLNSMVLGEPQILGQLKDAIRAAQECGTLNSQLNMLFQRTLSVAKEVRTKTDVGGQSVSMAAASVKLAEQIFPKIADLNVLFIGAGEMIELIATHFAAKKPKLTTIANRTVSRAENLSQKLDCTANAVGLDRLPEILHHYDVVIASTGSPLPIVGKGIVEAALKKRRYTPMFILDMAVPRDIEPQVADLSDAFLYTVDDMTDIVNSGKASRQKAAKQAEVLIEQQVAAFIDWQKSRLTVPLIRRLRDDAEQARQFVLANAMRQLAKGVPAEEVLERLSVQLTNKLLHAPTKALNPNAFDEEDLTDAVRKIYHLQEDEE
ncbi:MAG: glutamyl-tRNA reductase [Neisseriaceae bacterium]|nr:glutamyl-tRNA reductase [Neisseriaceae bacterium]MBQ9258691.1 glutamyl-tRNA reductase [Neisseriaceae bacterium]MBQ9725080.1 glutamyl-tRNA reductase [Neisseriaceae bacterium]MBR1819941.1 glutamyl-tRNA reductase [Neisseriaceae bacterium]